MKKLILPVLFAAAIFSSCDIVEAPYKETTDTPVDTSAKYVQNVLLEDYTGMHCGNCPAAADQAKALHDIYKDRVVIMGVHAGFFAKPKPGKSDYDFRTPVATELDNFFGIGVAGNPNGMINRVGYPSKSHIAAVASWSSKTAEILSQQPGVGISLKPEFNAATKTLTLEATTEFLKAAESDARLVVYLVEDSVIQYQLDYRKTPSDIPDFVHMHVLRGAVNSTWGDQLSTTPIVAGAKFTKNYTYTIPEGKDWKPGHMKIIAFVHKYSTTYEVLNVEEVELMD